MKIRSIRISKRLIIGFGIQLLLIGIIGLVSLHFLRQSSDSVENLYKHPFTVSNTVREINTNIISMHRSMKDLALSENELQILQAQQEVAKLENEVYRLFSLAEDRYLGDVNDVKKALDDFIAWQPIREEVINLLNKGNSKEAIAITRGKGANHVTKMVKSIDDLIQFANGKADELHKEVNRTVSSSIVLLLVLLIASVLISILVIIILNYSIVVPVNELNFVATKIEGGDLTIRNKTDSNDELNELAIAFNNMTTSIQVRNNIQNYIGQVSKSIIGSTTIEDFAKKIIIQLIAITEANLGVFYKFDSDSKNFIHLTSIGANKKLQNKLNNCFPEGDLSHVLNSKRIYHIKNIPSTTSFVFSTLAGVMKPTEILTIPFIVEDKVMAIVTLAGINSFRLESIAAIHESMILLNASYKSIYNAEETSKLASNLASSNQQLEAQWEELQNQSAELQEQNLELEMQRSHVEEANRLKSEFLSNMSHELRTPLNSILALSRVLIMQTDKKLDNEEHNYLEVIERNGKRLLTLINDILDLSKIEAGKIEIITEPVSMDVIITNTIENLRSLANNKGIELNVIISDNNIKIETDEKRLYQILTNIVGNALKFTEKGKVEISVCDMDEYIEIKVADTGIGIPEDQISYIFEEFRQVDGSTSRLFEGTGLGLAITLKLIKALKGHIEVESEESRGSTFTITLPKLWQAGIVSNSLKPLIIEDQTNLKRSVRQVNNEITPSLIHQNNGSRKKILIIEDNEVAVVQIQKILAAEGFDIDTMPNGAFALEQIKLAKPDGIILDLMMPEMDGFEFINVIQKNPHLNSIPILVLTAKTLLADDLAKLSGSNIRYLIQKGDIDMDGLLSRIKDMVGISSLNKVEATESPIIQNKTISKQFNVEPKILLIEDNEDNRTTIKALLRNRFNIIEAVDGESGLEMAKKMNPNLILLDMALPKMDGMEVIKNIRSNSRTKEIPVIALTAKAMKEDRDMIIKAGCNEYISKPIDYVEFHQKIKLFIGDD